MKDQRLLVLFIVSQDSNVITSGTDLLSEVTTGIVILEPSDKRDGDDLVYW